MDDIINKAIALRHILHKNPEPSGKEFKTRQIIIDFLKKETDLEIVDNGSWLYAVYHGDDNNPIAFRADHDAVLGQDGNVSHRCGHDGHTATLAALALYVSKTKPKRTVYFLFQPAEETGQGALWCVNLLKEKNVKEVYGYHNLPGFPYQSVVLRTNTFACASTGLKIHLMGTVAHAAYPETGYNPALAISQLVQDLHDYVNQQHKGVVQSTVIGIDCGSCAYGVSAFEGELRLTVRGEYQSEFDELIDYVKTRTAELANRDHLQYTIEEIERFPSTENTPEKVSEVEHLAKENNFNVIYPEEPIRWSEDFGYYLQIVPGCFFGVGDGEDYPQVHTINFEYPDGILPIALKMFISILEK